MKKFSILLLLFVLAGCDNRIASSIYVASMHFAVKDDKYEANYYIIDSLKLGVSDSTEKSDASLSTVEGKTISELFTKIDLSTALDVNFKHVASILLDVSFLKNEYIIELCENLKKDPRLSYNSCVFVSTGKAKDIYNIKNPGSENDLNSIINSPVSRDKLYLISEAKNLLTFIRDVLNGSIVKIPVFSLDDSWDTKGINYYVNGVCYYKDDKYNIYYKEEYPGLQFLVNHSLLQIGDKELSFYLKKFKVKYKYKEKLIIDIFFYYDVLVSKVLEPKYFVINYVLSRLIDLDELGIDYLNLSYINKTIKKEYTYNDIVYSIRCKD